MGSRNLGVPSLREAVSHRHVIMLSIVKRVSGIDRVSRGGVSSVAVGGGMKSPFLMSVLFL